MSTLVGARIAEIVVTHHARQFGASKYGISRAWRVFLDLFLIKMLTGFAVKPSLWFGLFSLIIMVLGAGVLIIALLSKSGIIWATVAFLFFALSGHFLMIGVLGEMIVYFGTYRPSKMIVVN